MKSPVVKRSIVVAGHKTSVSLEEAFWNSMKEISASRDMTLSDLVSEIDQGRKQGNLSSAIRLYVLDYYRSRASGASMTSTEAPLARCGADAALSSVIPGVMREDASCDSNQLPRLERNASLCLRALLRMRLGDEAELSLKRRRRRRRCWLGTMLSGAPWRCGGRALPGGGRTSIGGGNGGAAAGGETSGASTRGEIGGGGRRRLAPAGRRCRLRAAAADSAADCCARSRRAAWSRDRSRAGRARTTAQRHRCVRSGLSGEPNSSTQNFRAAETRGIGRRRRQRRTHVDLVGGDVVAAGEVQPRALARQRRVADAHLSVADRERNLRRRAPSSAPAASAGPTAAASFASSRAIPASLARVAASNARGSRPAMRACSIVTDPLPLRLPISDAALRPCPLTEVRADTRPAGIARPRCFSAAPSTPSSCTRPVSATPSGDLRADRSACSFPPPSPADEAFEHQRLSVIAQHAVEGTKLAARHRAAQRGELDTPAPAAEQTAIERLGAVVAGRADRNQQRRRHVEHVGADAAVDADLVAERKAEPAAHTRAADACRRGCRR